MNNIPSYISELDRNDPLAGKRAEFRLPKNTVYLDGNSLGVLPAKLPEHLAEVIERQWGDDLIGSWNTHNWIELPMRVGEKIAPLIGAAPGQVVCCDSISVNLFKVLAAALSMQPSRSKILSQTDNFPTDLYVTQGLSELLSENHCELHTVQDVELLDHLDESVAIVMLTQVNFRTGVIHNIEAITQRAHKVGALVVWDLAHSAGALELALDDWKVDFAVGCGYKYLNGGPGAPAFIYAAERHQKAYKQPLSGWMGHKNPFAFSPSFEAANSVEQFLAGTPPILSMAGLDVALDVFADVNMHQLRLKSIALSELFIGLVAEQTSLVDLQLRSPTQAEQRGSQVSYAHLHGYAIAQALIARNVIIDFRNPDIMRFGFTPLYTRFSDVWQAVQTLTEVVESRVFEEPRFQHRARVT